MKKLIFLLLFIPSLCFGGVLFQEDYDTPGATPSWTNWDCSMSIPDSSYASSKPGCSYSTYDSVTHYCGESTTGGRSGNSLKMWRRNGGTTDYCGYLNYEFKEADFHYRNLFFRYYIKIPNGWDANIIGGNTHKLTRANMGSSWGAPTQEWYFDVKGDTFKGGKITFYNIADTGCGFASCVYYTDKTVTQLGINDGTWNHWLEVQLKLSTNATTADGEVHFWVDGVEQTICLGDNPAYCSLGTTVVNGTPANYYFDLVPSPAVGNLSGGTWTFPTDGWYAMEFDDYVVSTEYIGPIASGGVATGITIGSGSQSFVIGAGSQTFVISP